MADESSTPPGRHKPLPQCKAFLLCEDVYEDEITDQFILHKVIDVFRFRAFPVSSEPFAIYLQLYDGIGRYDLSVQIRDMARGTSTTATLLGQLVFTERLAKMDVALPLARPSAATNMKNFLQA